MLIRPFAMALMAALRVAAAGCDADDDIAFTPCPLVGAYYPPPALSPTLGSVVDLAASLRQTFEDLIRNGRHEIYGEIFPNTTSFSFSIFGGDDASSGNTSLFEYHYTSPYDLSAGEERVGAETRFPIGGLTPVLTVYTWLAAMGPRWDEPILSFLPDLAALDSPENSWADLSVGSLAGQLSGLVRQSDVCVIGEECDWTDFVESLSNDAFVFLPDTTPVVSHTAFQLLLFAMQSELGADFADIISSAVLEPLGMGSTGLLSEDVSNVFAIQELNMSRKGEPGAVSLVSSVGDVVRAGQSMLDSTLVSPATMRNWLRPSSDTSNLRNGVGRPWEIYRSGATPISPVLPALTKAGAIGQYASYMGLVPELNVGFALLAHDGTVPDSKLDLNVHADIASEAVAHFVGIAAAEAATRYGGEYREGNDTIATLGISNNGPGLEVRTLRVRRMDLKAVYAARLGIQDADLDFRLYPSNVQPKAGQRQFVIVFQDKKAPIDAGTPTCITWQGVGAEGGVPSRAVFDVDATGAVTGMGIFGTDIWVSKV